MIDTIKVGIPLTFYQWRKLHKLASKDELWQWVQYQPSKGEVRFLRVKGLAELDRQSFHREIAWDVPDRYTPEETYLRLELSIPKFWYGHNIHLLYGFVGALRELRKQLQEQLHCSFAGVTEWKLFRVDICYAWRCPTQQISQQILESLKRLHYPRKKPIIYSETILFAGRTYSLKFYLKHPEFMQHDREALEKQNASQDWIDHLEQLAIGVIRCEATLRHQYLKQRNILTIAQLVELELMYQWSEDFIELNGNTFKNEVELHAIMYMMISHTLKERGLPFEETLKSIQQGQSYVLRNGDVFTAPPSSIVIHNKEYEYKGGSFTIKYQDNVTTILQYFITKFIGENRGMDTIDQVKSKLLEKYKPNKVARLLGFWMHVQKFGIQDAKNLYGKDSFYDAKSDLKLAGVSLVEPPKVINAADRFLERFSFDIPNEHATNSVDDYRESGNILNLPRYGDSG
jgi:hypothetical protein